MTPIEKTPRRTPGRPRKYGQGRINATVRFTPERHAALKAEADKAGRSVSEEVEFRVERAFSDDRFAYFERELRAIQDKNSEIADALLEKAMAQNAELKAELAALKTDRAADEERLFTIVEAAVTNALRASKGENK